VAWTVRSRHKRVRKDCEPSSCICSILNIQLSGKMLPMGFSLTWTVLQLELDLPIAGAEEVESVFVFCCDYLPTQRYHDLESAASF